MLREKKKHKRRQEVPEAATYAEDESGGGKERDAHRGRNDHFGGQLNNKLEAQVDVTLFTL